MLFRFDWRDSRVTLAIDAADPTALARRVSTLLALPALALALAEAAEVDLTAREREEGGGWLIDGQNQRFYAHGDDLLANLIAQIGQCFLRRTGLLLLHAAACPNDGEAVLFAGASRVGKSSLALAAWLAGHEFMADDVLAVDPRTRLTMTFPKALKPRLRERAVPEPLVSLLPDAHRLVGELSGEYRLLLGRGLPRMVAHERELAFGRLYLVERAPTGPSRVAPLPREAALRDLLAQVITTRPAAPMEAVRLLRDWWAEGRVYRLWLGENDLDRAVELMLP